jgi:2,3,4,5-tetrahydropyridine-2-carboxylate N-succinyltransferase
MEISRIGHRYIDSESGKTIDVWFPRSSNELKRSCLAEKVGIIKSDFITIEIESLDSPPQSTEDAYLRLHLLSECAVKPNELNLEGMFSSYKYRMDFSRSRIAIKSR